MTLHSQIIPSSRTPDYARDMPAPQSEIAGYLPGVTKLMEERLAAKMAEVGPSKSKPRMPRANKPVGFVTAEANRMGEEIRAAVAAMLQDGPMTARDVSRALDRNPTTTIRHLKKMLDAGLLTRDDGKRFRLRLRHTKAAGFEFTVLEATE